MSKVTRNLALLWRSEKILAEAKLNLTTKKLALGVIAGISCLFAWGMFNLALFFAIEPEIGQAWSAFVVGIADIVIAGVLLFLAQRMQPAAEEEMVREVRDLALAEIGAEVDQVQAGLTQLRDDVQTARDGIVQFVHHPKEILSPAIIGAVITAIAKLAQSRKR